MLRPDEDYHRVGVVHEVHRILGGKGGQYRHQHRPVGDDTEPDNAPLSTVLAQ